MNEFGVKLIISGSINVDSNIPVVAIADPKQRLEAYLSTVEWAINCKIFTEIVFCENTNYHGNEFDHLVDLANKQKKIFEYISFQGNISQIIAQGKGYGEGEIIQYCINNAKMVRFMPEDYFCKITGRLIVDNITELLPHNICKHQAYFMRKEGLDQIDTRFYCIKVDVYNRYFKSVYKGINDRKNYFLEHAFFETIQNNNISYHMFLRRPLFIGVAGSTGRIYDDKLSKYEIIYNFLCFTNLYNSQVVWKMLNFFRKV